MELVLNLIWAAVALYFVVEVYRGVRRGALNVSMASAMTLAVLICFIALPVISASDDLLAARQAGLPPSGQTWRMTSESLSAGLELPPIALILVLLLSTLCVTHAVLQDRWSIRLLSRRGVISERLRPPPPVSL